MHSNKNPANTFNLKQTIIYSIIAALSAISDIALFSLLFYLGLNYLASHIISRILGGCVSFILNKHLSFKHSTSRKTLTQIRRFLLLYLFSFTLSIVILSLLVDIAGLWPLWAKLLTDFICFSINFIVMKLYVFHHRSGLLNYCKRYLSNTMKKSSANES